MVRNNEISAVNVLNVTNKEANATLKTFTAGILLIYVLLVGVVAGCFDWSFFIGYQAFNVTKYIH